MRRAIAYSVFSGWLLMAGYGYAQVPTTETLIWQRVPATLSAAPATPVTVYSVPNQAGVVPPAIGWQPVSRPAMPATQFVSHTQPMMSAPTTATAPMMVLPMYAAIDRFDTRLLEAAYDLFASRWQVLRHVVLPVIRPGIVAGSILVFVPSLGAYVTPRVLGGGKNMMIGNFIELQFGQGQKSGPLDPSPVKLLVVADVQHEHLGIHPHSFCQLNRGNLLDIKAST